MQAHTVHSATRALAYMLAASSAAAMLYVGLYQSRAVQHLWCPVFGKGCEAVADAPFARPFGVPDGYIASVLYSIILFLLLGPVEKQWVRIPLLVLLSRYQDKFHTMRWENAAWTGLRSGCRVTFFRNTTLVGLATLANALGVRDMAQLGHFCFYCVFSTVASPVLLWLVWRLR